MKPLFQHKTFVIHVAQGFLYVAEQTSGIREGERHGLELPKDLVTVFNADPPLVGGGG